MTQGHRQRNVSCSQAPRHYRVTAAFALLATVTLGILSRRWHTGMPWWDKSLGDLLYAVAVYLVLGLFCSAQSPGPRGGSALALCAGVELFQLTGIPARYSELPAVRWLIGTRFSFHDLGCYLVGVLAVATLDQLWRRRRNANT